VTGTLAYAFVGVAILCVVAGVAAVSRTRRRGLEDDGGATYGEDDGGATYAEEAAAVAAAEAAARAAAPEQEDGVDGVPPA
jgi:hypothetical protein